MNGKERGKENKVGLGEVSKSAASDYWLFSFNLLGDGRELIYGKLSPKDTGTENELSVIGGTHVLYGFGGS